MFWMWEQIRQREEEEGRECVEEVRWGDEEGRMRSKEKQNRRE